MKLRIQLLFAAIGCSMLSPVFAQNAYSKNGWPCVKELCIADGIDELKKLPLISVKFTPYSNNPVFKRSQLAMENAVADIENSGLHGPTESIEKMRRYLAKISFDSALLDTLPRLYACKPDGASLTGSYKTESGLATYVTIALIPLKDGQSQKWMVTSIRRDWPNNLSSDQMNEFMQKLSSTYAEFNKPDAVKTTPTHVVINRIPSLQLAWDSYGLHPYTLASLRAPDMYLKHPACVPKMHSID